MAHWDCITFSLWISHCCLSFSLSSCLSLSAHCYLDIPVSFPFSEPEISISHHHLIWSLVWSTYCSRCLTSHPVMYSCRWYSLWHTNLMNANQIPTNAIKWLLREYLSLPFVFEVGLDWYIGLWICQAETSTFDMIRVFNSILWNLNPMLNLLIGSKSFWIPYKIHLGAAITFCLQRH